METTNNKAETFDKAFDAALKAKDPTTGDHFDKVVAAYVDMVGIARKSAMMAKLESVSDDDARKAIKLNKAVSAKAATLVGNSTRTKVAIDPVRRDALRIHAINRAEKFLATSAPKDILVSYATAPSTDAERAFVASLSEQIAMTAIRAGGNGTRETRKAKGVDGKAGIGHVEACVAASKKGDVLTTKEMAAMPSPFYPAGGKRPSASHLANSLRTLVKGKDAILLKGDNWKAEKRDDNYVLVVTK